MLWEKLMKDCILTSLLTPSRSAQLSQWSSPRTDAYESASSSVRTRWASFLLTNTAILHPKRHWRSIHPMQVWCRTYSPRFETATFFPNSILQTLVNLRQAPLSYTVLHNCNCTRSWFTIFLIHVEALAIGYCQDTIPTHWVQSHVAPRKLLSWLPRNQCTQATKYTQTQSIDSMV